MPERYFPFFRKALHPEMRGQEKDALPVSQRTLRKLKTTLENKFAGVLCGSITVENNTYTILVFPPEAQERLGKIATLTTQPHGLITPSTSYLLEPSSDKKRLQLHKTGDILAQAVEPDDIDITAGTIIPTGDLFTRLRDELHKDQDGQEQMRELTGLPTVSEGEVRGIIRDIRSGSVQKIA